jgi:hypothetical protein
MNRCDKQDEHRSGPGVASRSITIMFLYVIHHCIECERCVAISRDEFVLPNPRGAAKVEMLLM